MCKVCEDAIAAYRRHKAAAGAPSVVEQVVISPETLDLVRALFVEIRNSRKGSIGSEKSHYLPQLSVRYVDQVSKLLGL